MSPNLGTGIIWGHAMAHADLEFVRRPTQRDMDQRLAAGWRSPWKGGPQLRVRVSDGSWREFRSACAEPPVLYTREGDRIRLFAGAGQWELSAGDGTLKAAGRAERPASELLETWLSSRRRRDPPAVSAPPSSSAAETGA
ncbi:hypothetical protein [Actinomadura sp. GTD37]|uniref:hypothetical protein n=1 Tax=Actinomadura sp. GTD37 TaxID=1778030 RepID=UPI0035C1CD09